MSRSACSGIIVVLGIALVVGWYCIAANYDYDALAGTYTFSGNRETSKLILKSDRTFQQELRHDGKVETAIDTWHRIGEGGVDFSVGFLRIPGAKKYREEFPDHLDGTPADDQYYGHFEKVLGIYPELKFNVTPTGPTYYKRLFY